jgi:hypothetical protein
MRRPFFCRLRNSVRWRRLLNKQQFALQNQQSGRETAPI